MKKTLATAILPIALGLLLVGCTQDDANKEAPSIAQQSIPPEFQARAVVKHHSLSLLSETGELGSTERHDLDMFLAGVASGKPEAVHVRVSGVPQRDTREGLVRVLVADGIEPSKIEFAAASPLTSAGSFSSTQVTTASSSSYSSSSSTYTTSTKSKSHRHHRHMPTMAHAPVAYFNPIQVDVAAEIYTPVPPSCPRTSRTAIAGNDNGLASNWGCSYVSVFEQMVVDPRDLVHGQGGSTTDSEVTSGAIDRMRKDKLKPLTDTGSVTLNSAGGGGGGGQ